MALIVVADDDVDIRDLVEFKLATLGHQIVTVADGSSAVDACRTSHPDLAVLDVMMPGLTGLEAVREIRNNPALKDIPVILLTARAQQSDVQTGYDSGADDYITKPFSPKDLASPGRGAARARWLSRRAFDDQFHRVPGEAGPTSWSSVRAGAVSSGTR